MVYILIYILLIGVTYFYDFRGKIKNKNSWFNFFLYFFIFMSGFRYYIGSDTFDYVIEYREYPTLDAFSFYTFNSFKYQPGWILFMSLCKTFSKSFLLPQLIVAIFFNKTVFGLIKKYSEYPFITLLFYFTAQVFTSLNFEFMRETMAVSFFLYAFKYYSKNKWISYYMFVFIAFMFHVSVSLFFLFPLVKLIKLNKKRFLMILGMIFFIVVFFGKRFVSQILEFLIFEDSLSIKAHGYGNNALESTKSFNYLLYIFSTYLFFPLLLIYVSIISNKNNIQFFNILLLYFTISIFSSLSADFIRFNHYLFVFLIIELASSFYYVFRKLKPKVFFIILIPLLLNFTNYHYLFANKGSFAVHNQVYKRYQPYNSIFDKGISDERKKVYRSLSNSNSDYLDY